jgi:hypothetical protein
MNKLARKLKSWIGKKVAVLCVRYQYRGILTAVNKDFLTLSNACAVEESGATHLTKPKKEDPIEAKVYVPLDATEIIYRPKWCKSPLPGEKGYKYTAGHPKATKK